MKNKLLAVCLALTLMVSSSGSALAAKITLKNGEVIEAPILERETYLIRVKLKGVPQTIYMGEIESIEEDVPKVKEEPRAPEDLERKRELILRLMDANHAKESMQRTFWQIIEQSPPEAQHKLRKTLNVNDVLEKLVVVYSEYYTEQDIQDMLTFFSSPSGQKMLKTAPDLLKKTSEVLGEYFKALEGNPQQVGPKELPRGGNPLAPR